MRNIALKLMYNGSAYHGWQIQKTEVTVAQTLQRAISKVCGENVSLTGCGRTDAGVHAECYVANFRTNSRIPVDRLPFAINTHTPEDIVVTAAFEVDEAFNAIGSCIKKEYTYRIFNSRIKNPFYVNRAYFYPKHLDEEVMDRAARAFEGTHDFAAFMASGSDVEDTVRTMYLCRAEEKADTNEIVVRLKANGFLYNMVRIIVGTLIDAASGRIDPDEIENIILSKDRKRAGFTVPAKGLFLNRIEYGENTFKNGREE